MKRRVDLPHFPATEGGIAQGFAHLTSAAEASGKFEEAMIGDWWVTLSPHAIKGLFDEQEKGI